jgi:siroheme synthase
VISRGSLPDEQVVVGTLADIAQLASEAGLATPATLVVGEVVRLREDLCHDPATISSLLSQIPPRSLHSRLV